MSSFRTFANKKMEPHIAECALMQYAGWQAAGASELEIRTTERADTADAVSRHWGAALDLLDQALSVTEEFGMVHVHRLRAAPKQFPRTYPLLIDLHSRGVQVAEEILVLLRAGFAAGAEARWRTLHETAVVALFIARHGEETVARFAEHDHVRVKRAMGAEQEHHEALGIEPYTEEEMQEARAKYDDLKTRYGAAFLGDYGWAAHALGRKPTDKRSPTFVEIEASLDLRIARPAYRSASDAIHAGPGALTDNPGKREGATPMFLTRGTPFGLRDPGVRTAGSMAILSRALMEWRPFPIDLVAIAAMGLMVREVSDLFRECDERLDREVAGARGG